MVRLSALGLPEGGEGEKENDAEKVRWRESFDFRDHSSPNCLSEGRPIRDNLELSTAELIQ